MQEYREVQVQRDTRGCEGTARAMGTGVIREAQEYREVQRSKGTARYRDARVQGGERRQGYRDVKGGKGAGTWRSRPRVQGDTGT